MPTGTDGWTAAVAVSAVGSSITILWFIACTILAERTRIVWKQTGVGVAIIDATGGSGGGSVGGGLDEGCCCCYRAAAAAAAAAIRALASVLDWAAAFALTVRTHCRR